MQFSLSLLGLAALLPLVAGHCKITAATGDLGGKGTALGITAGSGNSEADVTVFQGSGAKTFGETPGGGNIDAATALTAAEKVAGSTTLPQVSVGGVVTMTLHQVNADGAGPMACSVNADGTGAAFVTMDISTNVPGTNGRSTAANQDFPLVATLPKGLTCTGTVAGVKSVCFVRCQNPAGPFGGTVAVQMVGANNAAAAAGNSTINAGNGTSNTENSTSSTGNDSGDDGEAECEAGTGEDENGSQAGESKGNESKGNDSKGSNSKGIESKGSVTKGIESKGSVTKGSVTKGSSSKGSSSKGSSSKGSSSKGSSSKDSNNEEAGEAKCEAETGEENNAAAPAGYYSKSFSA